MVSITETPKGRQRATDLQGISSIRGLTAPLVWDFRGLALTAPCPRKHSNLQHRRVLRPLGFCDHVPRHRQVVLPAYDSPPGGLGDQENGT